MNAPVPSARVRTSAPPHRLWSPVAAAAALLAPGALALVTQQVFLFASLGPTAVMLAHEPQHPGSRPYSVLVGHTVGLAAAFASVAVLGLAHTPSVFEVHTVSGARVAAAVLALAVGTAIELLLRAQHPPAASTTLLAALGSFHPTWHDTGLVLGGVVAITVSGEAIRRLRLRFQDAPLPDEREPHRQPRREPKGARSDQWRV